MSSADAVAFLAELVREELSALSELALEVACKRSDDIVLVAQIVADVLQAGGKIMFCGN